MKIKIYYHQTDCGGVVYYANYLHFIEEARTEFLSERGISIKELIDQGSFFVVSHQEIDYKSPAGYGDTLEISTQLKGITAVRINLEHKITKDGLTLVAEAKTTLAFVGKDFRPKPIPDEIRGKIEAPGNQNR
jgi:acyl-CoA thioester hydrolase